MKQIEYRSRMLDRAHKRLLSAIKALSTLRKVPITLQVNIADQQINTASIDAPGFPQGK